MLRFIGLGLALIALLSTALWLSQDQTIQLASRSGVLSLALLATTIAATCLNLLLRWFRWHFLLRRFAVRLRTRASLLVYLATLPAILTPFYLGELVRTLVFTRQDARLKRQSIYVWLIERGTDAAVLAAACLWKLFGEPWAVLALFVTLVLLVLLLRSIVEQTASESSPGGTPASAFTLFGATVLSWALPMVSLWLTVNLLGERVSIVNASFAFSASTLLGAVSGIPGGIAIAGSSEIMLLRPANSDIVARSVAIFRLGTVWFSVALGASLLWFKRSTVVASVAAGVHDHFSELASDYEGELSLYTREKLIERKVEPMQLYLSAHVGASPQRGLDVGCGQGWYAAAMAANGHTMIGIDPSSAQIKLAVTYTQQRDRRPSFLVASGAQLPFRAGTFDFVYSINALHHILDEAARRSCYQEIVRVLKPGGAFILHEMNTENPLFRLYLSYVYPLLTRIDEGNERWIRPSALPEVAGAAWDPRITYFTFLPDFTPQQFARWLAPLERWLERSPHWSRYSAHYAALLVKDHLSAVADTTRS